MGYRLTLLLLVVLFLSAGYVYFYQVRSSPERPEEPPWFYSIDESWIISASFLYQGERVSFSEDEEGKWHFDSPQGPEVNPERWGGVTTLLSGGLSKGLLTEDEVDLSPYGLDSPQLRITVGLKDDIDFTILVGDKTPDGSAYYVQLEGWPHLFIMDASWGNVMIRLVTEPPYLTPTPGPEPTPTAQASGE